MMKLTSLAISACIAFSAMATPSTAETPGDAKNSQSNYFPATSDELLDLIKNCDTDDCMSYISGVIGGIAIYAIIAEKPSPFCTRGNVDTDTIRQAIVSTIETTPQLEQQHPALAILTTFGRHWPCITADDMQSLQSTPVDPLAQIQIDAFITENGHSLIYGDPEAPVERTIRIFHDPNCNYCMRFSAEAKLLADRAGKSFFLPGCHDHRGQRRLRSCPNCSSRHLSRCRAGAA